VITVVTGPPCSGKSTFAVDRARPGDVVIDFDRLARALGSPSPWEHPPLVEVVALAAWRGALGAALRRPPGGSAWIVDGRPSADRRGAYLASGAIVVPLGADLAELHRRAHADRRPAITHELIDCWRPRLPAEVRVARRGADQPGQGAARDDEYRGDEAEAEHTLSAGRAPGRACGW
jgi:hypothetical protein